MTKSELLADLISAGGKTTTVFDGIKITRINGKRLQVTAERGELDRGQLATFRIWLNKAGYREGRTIKASRTDGIIMEIKAK